MDGKQQSILHKELPGKLLQFKNNRKELIARVRKIYETISINLLKQYSQIVHTI